jgi:CheY-like chemotaxis protein
VAIKHICLIDDDEIMPLLVAGLLKRLTPGMAPIRFESYVHGQQALEGLKRVLEDDFPDLILLDLGMPVMDGHSFLKHYAERYANQHPDTKIVVLTSSLLKEDKLAINHYPFVKHYMIKPLLLTQLKQLLELESVKA